MPRADRSRRPGTHLEENADAVRSADHEREERQGVRDETTAPARGRALHSARSERAGKWRSATFAPRAKTTDDVTSAGS